jgi:serine/threonine-protein kinase PknK
VWFAENGYLNEAVDHALAAGDPGHAVDLVELDGTRLLEHSKMTTLLGIVKKLSPDLVVGRPRLQLVIAWANILLQRPALTDIALNRFQAAPWPARTSQRRHGPIWGLRRTWCEQLPKPSPIGSSA